MKKAVKYLFATVLAGAAILIVPGAARASITNPLAVSFTFDDGVADQLTAQSLLQDHAMVGTFYINSALIGMPSYMTRSQLDDLAANGHEIGGHTATHQDLLTLVPDEQNRQICTDRNTLLSWGFDVTSFAYPFANLDPGIEATAQHCGYNSARAVGDLYDATDCDDCPPAETVPPADAYAVRTPDDVEVTTTLAELQDLVTRAEVTGGWLPFNLHHLCDTGCPAESISSATLDAFLDWLAPRTAVGTTVKRVDQVVGGAVHAAVPATAPPAPGDPGVNTVRNPSLEDVSAFDPNLPDCWQSAGYGDNTAVQTRVTDAHTGGFASQIQVTALTDGDAKVIPRFDLGACSSQVAPGRTYQASAWYKSDVPVFFTLYQRNALGQWSYWTQSPRIAPSATWQHAVWNTPAPPATAVAASSGLTIDSVGTLVVDDLGFADNPLSPAPDGVNALVNPSLETPGADGYPACWTGAGYGSNTPVWTRVTDAADGAYAQKLELTDRDDGDAKLIPGWDSGNCAPLVTPGKTLSLSVSYHGTQPTYFTLYRQDTSGNWSWWTQSPPFAAAASYTTASWVTPVVPSGTRAVSFGLTLDAVGEVTTDNYSLVSH
ncbi:polysaccharide deacetylase family protein [Actinoplanes sp. NPDC026619]|uniref:polysaccharide deacetylase family protein n=1 Tax=Actinoplanes sp. NPDC026619 TaxID=3155798 RepID=UPI0033D0DEC8